MELLLDPAAEDVVRAQWADLKAAGLPSEQRENAHSSHRPHLTLFAADELKPDAEARLAGLVAGLQLPLLLGALTVFGPRRGRCILVRQVVPTRELLELQTRVSEICTDLPDAHFAYGSWVPHVTLAHRVEPGQLGAAVDVLGEQLTTTTVRRCRRWDSDAKRTWLLTG